MLKITPNSPTSDLPFTHQCLDTNEDKRIMKLTLNVGEQRHARHQDALLVLFCWRISRVGWIFLNIKREFLLKTLVGQLIRLFVAFPHFEFGGILKRFPKSYKFSVTQHNCVHFHVFRGIFSLKLKQHIKMCSEIIQFFYVYLFIDCYFITCLGINKTFLKNILWFLTITLYIKPYVLWK